ncbi:MAG: hypothetical protein Q6373_010040 [Candidatus Sigynarchaeota archaeon]
MVRKKRLGSIAVILAAGAVITIFIAGALLPKDQPPPDYMQ